MLTHPEPRVRACHVGGCVVLVLLDRGDDGRWRARHTATGAFGYGATEDDALDMLQDQMETDARWYAAHGELPMTGITARIRTAYARLFGGMA